MARTAEGLYRLAQELAAPYPEEYPAISEKEGLRTANENVAIVADDVDWAIALETEPAALAGGRGLRESGCGGRI